MINIRHELLDNDGTTLSFEGKVKSLEAEEGVGVLEPCTVTVAIEPGHQRVTVDAREFLFAALKLGLTMGFRPPQD
jgi:hypothetical protein